MAKKEKPKPKKKKSINKDKDKKSDKEPEKSPTPPVRAHHDYEISRPPLPAKITAERGKHMAEEHEEQQQSQSKKSSQGGKGGGGGNGGESGGGGDAIKAALGAIVAFVDDTGYVALDPRLQGLLASAKKALTESESG